jgi:hypothetical protein
MNNLKLFLLRNVLETKIKLDSQKCHDSQYNDTKDNDTQHNNKKMWHPV